MVQVAEFADVEDLLCRYLEARTTGLGRATAVATRFPDPRPVEYVRLFVTGGDQPNPVVDGPLVTVEAYAPTETAAQSLASMCRSLMKALRSFDGVTFYGVRPASRPQNLPDPTTPGAYRYTASYVAPYRGTPIEI